MVLIDGKKFACGACVKGHRSTSCTHTNRSLIEIGKKGRPPTQCAHCRELRRTSKVHSKCMCGDKPAKRTRHLTVLPNGLATISTPSPLPHPNPPGRQSASFELVNQILNPCTCARGGACCCATTSHSSKQPEPPLDSSPPSGPSRPACCSDRPPPPPILAPPPPPKLNLSPPLPDQQPTSSAPPDPQPTLFAPQTAGTALCFCGIHCPCPGCVLHDPHGLKFTQMTLPSTACPTRIRLGEGCLGGLDLPTVNGLMNLSPISGSFGGNGVQLPGVSETFGGEVNGGQEERAGWGIGGGRSEAGCCVDHHRKNP